MGFSDFLATLRAVFIAVFFATNLVNLYIGKMSRVSATLTLLERAPHE